MRKLFISLVAAAALAGGALTGSALASPDPHHHDAKTEARSVDRHASHDVSRDRTQASHEGADR